MKEQRPQNRQDTNQEEEGELSSSRQLNLRNMILEVQQTMNDNSIYIVFRNRQNEIKYLGSDT